MSKFPDNWEITGLYVEGKGHIEVSDKNVRDSDISHADAIIVKHTNPVNGVVSHRVIHGAGSKAKVGDLIRTVVIKGSPPGRRRSDK